MLIYKNSKKGGFAVGSNQPSKETYAGLGAAFLAVIALGFFSLFKPKKPARNKKVSKKEKLKKALNLAAILPIAFKLGKSVSSRLAVDRAKKQWSEGADKILAMYDEGEGIPVEDAIPISSEEEVYEFCKESTV